jgi:hypothetical protein
VGLTDEQIADAVARYERERDRYQKLTDFVHEACVRLVGDNAIPATVQSRTKNPDRLKLEFRAFLGVEGAWVMVGVGRAGARRLSG